MSAIEQVTAEHIFEFVSAVMAKETAQPPDSVYYTLLDQCLAEVFRETEAFDTSWSNASDGDLDLDSGNWTKLPIACLRVVRVEWDGSDNPLAMGSLKQLDLVEPGWRDATGEPGKCVITGRRLFLNSTPSSPTGKLVIRGYGVPPRNDALAYFPVDVQRAPATYILSELPWDPEKPVEKVRHQEYTDKWLGTPRRVGDKARMLNALMARSMEDYDGP